MLLELESILNNSLFFFFTQSFLQRFQSLFLCCFLLWPDVTVRDSQEIELMGVLNKVFFDKPFEESSFLIVITYLLRILIDLENT